MEAPVNKKKCTKCAILQTLDQFCKDVQKKDGLNSHCKTCRKIKGQKYYKQNKEFIIEKTLKYHRFNGKERYKKNREKLILRSREYTKNNKDKISEYKKQYRTKNRARIDAKNLEIQNRRYKTDGLYRLKQNVRSRTRSFFSKNKKFYKTANKTFYLVGCSFNELRRHLESQFKPGMIWDNYGEWHVDHIIPLASAKTQEEVYRLCKYTNLQPLWETENLKKGNKLE